MPTFVVAAKTTDLPPGKGKCITLNGAQIALFNVGGAFHAISNSCPHRGGPLGEGALDGTVVTCPWHGFTFDVTSGRNTDGGPMGVASYPVRVENGAVEIGLD